MTEKYEQITHTWRSAKVQEDFTLLQKSILLVQLDQFESSSSTISLLLGKFIPLIQTALAVFLLDRHGGESIGDI